MNIENIIITTTIVTVLGLLTYTVIQPSKPGCTYLRSASDNTYAVMYDIDWRKDGVAFRSVDYKETLEVFNKLKNKCTGDK